MDTAVMEPLLVPAFPEMLHLNSQQVKHRRSTRTKTISYSTLAGAAEELEEYDHGLPEPVPRSKTMPGLDALRLPPSCPEGLVVRNTFLEEEQPAFVELRRVRSAPSTPMSGKVSRDDSNAFGETLMREAEEVAAKPIDEGEKDEPAVLSLATMLTDPMAKPDALAKTSTMLLVPSRVSAVTAILSMPVMLGKIGTAIAVSSTTAVLGSAELPTEGSRGHHIRQCKPCAFMWRQPSCANGVGCPFCHLCDAGEKRRRMKEKKAETKILKSVSS